MDNHEVKNVIWSSDFNVDDFQEIFDEDYPDISEEDKYQVASEFNYDYFCDEKENLDIPLNNQILIIGKLGLWNRTVPSSYRETDWHNISDCLSFEKDCQEGEWFIDENHDLCSRQAHHDGSNLYLYRQWRKNVSKDALLNKIYDGTADWKDIERNTLCIGKKIEKVYGWS